MRRDPGLRGLSSEHHQALVLARTVTRLVAAGQAEAAAQQLDARFQLELEPHFRVEESLLLPALRALGEAALVEQTEADHLFLRATAAAVRAGDRGGLLAFAERLTAHVRFEERALFPCCEAKLPRELLDAVAQRTAASMPAR